MCGLFCFVGPPSYVLLLQVINWHIMEYGCGWDLQLLIFCSSKDQQMSESEMEACGQGCGDARKMIMLGFEKNYPKNIFIPILEYLNDIGLRENYQQCVGTRELFEGKNVVSLAVLHQLISQAWFTQAVDRKALLASVCSKVLVNSKIKKKLFHLKVAEVVIADEFPNEKDFRHHVSRRIAQLTAARIQDDELFAFPNLTIYLFHLMASVMNELLIPRFDFNFPVKSELKFEEDEEEESHANKPHVSSKQEFRLYTKLILRVFNDQRYKVAQFASILEKIQDLLVRRQRQFQEKYGLADGILNWSIFMTEIVEKCFACKRRGYKLTNMALNQWIDNFKTISLRTNSRRKCKEQRKIVMEEHTDHEEKAPITPQVLSHASRIFHPIILFFPSQISPTSE